MRSQATRASTITAPGFGDLWRVNEEIFFAGEALDPSGLSFYRTSESGSLAHDIYGMSYVSEAYVPDYKDIGDPWVERWGVSGGGGYGRQLGRREVAPVGARRGVDRAAEGPVHRLDRAEPRLVEGGVHPIRAPADVVGVGGIGGDAGDGDQLGELVEALVAARLQVSDHVNHGR